MKGMAPAVFSVTLKVMMSLLRWVRRLGVVSLFSLPQLGCQGLDFPIQQPIGEQQVEGNALSGLLDEVFDTPLAFDVDIEAETAARKTGPAKRVSMESLTLSITDTALGEGDDDDFDFLSSLSIYIEATAAGSELERQKIGELSNVPRGAKEISIPTDMGVNLLPYAKVGATISSEVTASVPPDDVTFDGEYVLLVEVF